MIADLMLVLRSPFAPPTLSSLSHPRALRHRHWGKGALFLNFGDQSRAQSFLARRLAQGYEGSVIKSFDVPTSYVNKLRSMAVPENLARQFPNSPFAVDVNQAADQFGLREAQFEELASSIIPGSGRIWG